MKTATPEAPAWTPPRWANKTMKAMLKTPFLQRIVGRSTALLTFTGRESGKAYTTPISYIRHGNRVILTGHRTRNWWRNLEKHPEVELRLAGRVYQGRAEVSVDPESSLLAFVDFLEAQPPSLARLTGVTLDDNGHADLKEAREAHDFTAVVEVEIEA